MLPLGCIPRSYPGCNSIVPPKDDKSICCCFALLLLMLPRGLPPLLILEEVLILEEEELSEAVVDSSLFTHSRGEESPRLGMIRDILELGSISDSVAYHPFRHP